MSEINRSKPRGPGVKEVLLVTDRPDRSAERERQLGGMFACRTVSVDELSTLDANAAAVVFDVDLDKIETVQGLRKTLGQWHRDDCATVFLLHKDTWGSRVQAHALGGMELLSAHVSSTHLVATVAKAAGATTGAEARLESRDGAPEQVAAAHCSLLADLMAAASSGGRVDERRIETGAQQVAATIATAGIHKWLDVVWVHDDVTYQHCLLVTGLAAAFSQHLGFSSSDCTRLTKAALVHDLGKAKIPAAILKKPAALSDEELAVMRTHPRLGYDMLWEQGCRDSQMLDVTLRHHEYLDGSGYPDGLVGSQISDPVRLITICDIYAALIERRPYKQPLAASEAFSILSAKRDQLERALVEQFGTAMAGATAMNPA